MTTNVRAIASQINAADTVESVNQVKSLPLAQLDATAFKNLKKVALDAADTPAEAKTITRRFEGARRKGETVSRILSDSLACNDRKAAPRARYAMARMVSALRIAVRGNSDADKAALQELNALETELGLPLTPDPTVNCPSPHHTSSSSPSEAETETETEATRVIADVIPLPTPTPTPLPAPSPTVVSTSNSTPPPAPEPVSASAPAALSSSAPAIPPGLVTNDAYPGVLFDADTGLPNVQATFPDSNYPSLDFYNAYGTAPFDNILDEAMKFFQITLFNSRVSTERIFQRLGIIRPPFALDPNPPAQAPDDTGGGNGGTGGGAPVTPPTPPVDDVAAELSEGLETNDDYPGVIFSTRTGAPLPEATFPEEDYPFLTFFNTFGTVPFDNIDNEGRRSFELNLFNSRMSTEVILQRIGVVSLPPALDPFA